MEDIRLTLDKQGRGGFYLFLGEEQIGEMAIGVSGDRLTVYHTEVIEREEGKGYAKKIFDKMVEFAREKGLRVSVVCPYVRVQFMRQKETYADVWNRDDE